mgnify:CR=1 FL=1
MLEKEVKFISSANTQIKFYNQSISAKIFDKIGELLEALNIEVVERFVANPKLPPTRIDYYFDDDWHLFTHHCSVSIRRHKNDIDGERPPDKLIVKTGETRGTHSGGVDLLTRQEYEAPLSPGEMERFLRQGLYLADIHALIPDVDLPLDPQDRLVRKGEAYIRRSYFVIGNDPRRYRVSVDRFYYKSEFDEFSETFTEVEFEDRSEIKDFEPKVIQLMKILRAMLDVEFSPTSKFRRFQEFSVHDDFEEFYFVGFDIVSYSNEHSWAQKQAVQLFHKIIKDGITTGGFTERNRPLMISIGDGAILALRANWHNIIKVIKKIGAAIERSNADDQVRKIEYRTAVHYGAVFRFTDLNDSINVAGEGVNTLSRLLEVAQGGQIVLSQEAYERVIDTGRADQRQFVDLGIHTIKHGRTVQVYEYRNIPDSAPPAKQPREVTDEARGKRRQVPSH